jgi:NitT/TauT family transport system permease protein
MISTKTRAWRIRSPRPAASRFWSGFRRMIRLWALRIGAVVALLVLWEFLSRNRIVDPFFISSPSAIGAKFFRWLRNGTIADNLTVTLFETIFGWVVGSVAGAAAGFALARADLVHRVLEPFIDVINAVPRLALAPLFIVWFGIGVTSKVALVVSIVFFVLLVNTYAGATSVDRDFRLMARVMRASPWQITFYIVIPFCIPYVFAGLRLGLAYSASGAIVGEFVASESGLGSLLAREAGLLDMTGQLAALLALLIMVAVINFGMASLERRLLRWRPGSELTVAAA